ncbi:MAG: MAPEG family protein [Proteobacteria bacterium]|nr:MAPEG family protein [Pseudomonadota bacterium]
MDLVIIVVVLALIQFIVFGILVGRARGKYNVSAPATSGDPVFERYNRVHMNTLEQLAVFLPSIFIYSHVGSPAVAAGLGVVYLVGRLVYLRSYIADPATRGAGFGMTALPSMFMLLASLFIVIRNLITG